MASLTVTPTQTFISGDTVLPATLNQLAQSTVALTAGTIVDADVSASAAIALSKLATGALPAAITVASANMVTATAQALLPAGAVMAFAMNSAPAGWLAANGAAVSRSTYATLFAAIGTTHGAGDGSTTFNLPDLRGYFIRGAGTNGDGVAAGAFAEKQGQAIQSHTHTFVEQGAIQNSVFTTRGGTGMDGAYDISRTTNATGGTETRPANIALLYCIKF